MKIRIHKIWKDPVGSKIIANLIWVGLLGIVTSIYLLYQKINLTITFKQAWQNLISFFDQEKTITNWHILFTFLLVVILLVNRKIVINILLFLLKASCGIRKYKFNQNYNFTNKGKRSTGVISNERSFDDFKIKPQGNSRDWSLLILFSHNYSYLEKEDTATEKIKIYKKFTDNKLCIASFNQEEEQPHKTETLIDNYEDQEFELSFALFHDAGGIILKIRRLEKEIYKTDVKYGCKYFKMLAEDSNYDFDLKIDYVRFE